MPQKRKAPGKASDHSGLYYPSSGMGSASTTPSSSTYGLGQYTAQVSGSGRHLSREQLRKANHSLIERRRREKMNAAYQALRSLVPSLADEEDAKGGETFKLDVLERTVTHMKELKERNAELEAELSGARRQGEGLGDSASGITKRKGRGGAQAADHSRGDETTEGDDASEGETQDGSDADASGQSDDGNPGEERRRGSPQARMDLSVAAQANRSSCSPRPSTASTPLSPAAHPSGKVIWHSPASRRMQAAAHAGTHCSDSTSWSPAKRHSPLSPHARSQRSTMSAPLSVDADSEATVPDERLPADGTIHPASRKSKSSSEGSGSTTTGGGSMDPPPPPHPRHLPSLAQDHSSTPSSIVALLNAEASDIPASSASTSTRFAMGNHRSEAARAARVAAGAGQIRNPDLYLPPPVQSVASPNSPFFMVDPGRDDSGRGHASQPFGRITEPSPLLPPLMGVSSLFPGVAGLRQDSCEGNATGTGASHSSAMERDPIAQWRRSPSTRHAPSSATSSTTDSSIGLTDDSPRFGPSAERSGSIEEQAATLLLSFSSPEVLTPMHYPTGFGATGYGQGYLDKWTLDQQTAVAASQERRASEVWRDSGYRSAKTASDILDMSRP